MNATWSLDCDKNIFYSQLPHWKLSIREEITMTTTYLQILQLLPTSQTGQRQPEGNL